MMEKLLEDLIERLEETRKRLINELKANPVDSENRISLLLSGEVLAYDACIQELKKLVAYFNTICMKE